MGRRPCCAKEGLNRGAWSAKEDAILTEYIKTHGEGKWRDLPKRSGLKRCGKSCRLRWLNYLRPDIKRGNISEDEELLIIKLHKLLGNRWSLIAGRLPGRTDNEIKNYWNTNLSKKLKTQRYQSESSNSEPHKVIRTKAMRCTKIYNIPPPHSDVDIIKTTDDDDPQPQCIVDSTFSLPLDLNIDELINSLHDNDLFNVVLDNHESTAVMGDFDQMGPAKSHCRLHDHEAMQELEAEWRELGDDLIQSNHVLSEMRQFASLLESQEEWQQN